MGDCADDIIDNGFMDWGEGNYEKPLTGGEVFCKFCDYLYPLFWRKDKNDKWYLVDNNGHRHIHYPKVKNT